MFIVCRCHSAGERPFACTFEGCGATFSQKSSLAYHLSVHTNYRPNKCEFPNCTASFPTLSALNVHINNNHGRKRKTPR